MFDEDEWIGRACDDVGIFVSAFGNCLHVSSGVGTDRTALATKNLTREVIDVWQFD